MVVTDTTRSDLVSWVSPEPNHTPVRRSYLRELRTGLCQPRRRYHLEYDLVIARLQSTQSKLPVTQTEEQVDNSAARASDDPLSHYECRVLGRAAASAVHCGDKPEIPKSRMFAGVFQSSPFEDTVGSSSWLVFLPLLFD